MIITTLKTTVKIIVGNKYTLCTYYIASFHISRVLFAV